MFYVNDELFDGDYVKACFERFDVCPVVSDCAGKRLTVCLQDPALWLSLCLYIKEKGGSVFPLPTDTPIEAARERAKKSSSHYLLYGDATAQYDIEKISESRLGTRSVLIQMSSGTTGSPKIIERDWSSIDAEINAYVEHFSESNNMTPVVAAPITHSYGLICGVLVAFKRQIQPIIISNLNPKYILRKLEELQRPILYSSPTLITTVVMLHKSDIPIYAIMTSGTLLQKKWFEKIKNKTQHLYQQYGCSEAGCISIGKDIAYYDDLGQALPHQTLSCGESIASPDEICVHSKLDGRIGTKDLGYIDAEGRLRFMSRIDDMINVSGLNVYPGEVEEVVLGFTDIDDAVVYKKKAALGHEQVCLNFVARQEIAVEDIRSWCVAKLATHQIPIHIHQVAKIEKLPNGKVNRKRLSEAV